MTSANAAPASAAPKLIIVISVDQFGTSIFQRYANNFKGGLRRLSNGIAFPVGYQSHAATETCPGHSTLLTGDHPSRTGIVANSWFDRRADQNVYCVSVPGARDNSARGPQNLYAPTLGDWLKRAHPSSRVVSIAGKDRAAIMMAGHRPDLVAWWSDSLGKHEGRSGFATSSYAGPAGPMIQTTLDRQNASITSSWRGRQPQLWPSQLTADCKSLQRAWWFGDLNISGTVPPTAALEAVRRSDFPAGEEFSNALRASPLFDTITLDFAGTMIERWRLGRGPTPDLLAISLSATDYIGHRYGNGGAEMCAQVHALDASLADFLGRIDRLKIKYIVVLTADHGSLDAAERLQRQGISAQRIDTFKFRKELNAYLRQALNVTQDLVAGSDLQQLYIRSHGDDALRARVRNLAVRWLRGRPEVAAVLTSEMVAAAVPITGKSAADLTLAERHRESFDAARSADIFVAFKPNTTFGWPRQEVDSVAGHGSPWDYDRQVPILFWWNGAPHVGSAAAVETVDIAPTLAAMAGIRAPSVDGHCVATVVRCVPKTLRKPRPN